MGDNIIIIVFILFALILGLAVIAMDAMVLKGLLEIIKSIYKNESSIHNPDINSEEGR